MITGPLTTQSAARATVFPISALAIAVAGALVSAGPGATIATSSITCVTLTGGPFIPSGLSPIVVAAVAIIVTPLAISTTCNYSRSESRHRLAPGRVPWRSSSCQLEKIASRSIRVVGNDSVSNTSPTQSIGNSFIIIGKRVEICLDRYPIDSN
ncbi:MAG: hypothetical protein ACR2RE_01230, partial [Geminicoccaceae bacterium]